MRLTLSLLLLLIGFIGASAQSSLISAVEKLRDSDSGAVVSTVYRELRDPNTHKLRERLIILDIKDEYTARKLCKIIRAESEKADELSIEDNAGGAIYKIYFNTARPDRIQCLLQRQSFGLWQLYLRQNYK